MSKVIRGALIVLTVGLAVAGGYWIYLNRVAPSASRASDGYSQVVAVRRGSLSSTVSVVGQLEAMQRAELAFSRMSGTARLVSLTVKPGNTVVAGQVLATIDPAPYKQALEQAESALQAAEKALADLTTPPTALQIAQADLAIARARLQLQQAQDALDKLLRPDIPALEAAVVAAQSALAKAQADVLARQQDTAGKDQLARLRNAEATPTALYNRLAAETYSDAYYQDRLELAFNRMMDARDPRATNELQAQIGALQAQTALRKSEKTLADAVAALADARAGAGASAEAALAVVQARLALQEAQVALLAGQEARRKLDAGADATALATAQAAVAKQRQAVSEAAADLAAATLVAPFAGTVLQTRAGVGDQLTANSVVVSLADMKALQVVAAVDETTIRRIGAGQAAQISFDAYPGQRFRGQVQALPLQGALQGGVMVYDVPVSLAGAEKLALLVGMTANVQIQVAQAADALLVPAMAVQRVGGQAQVLVVNPAAPEQPAIAVPVEVGLSDGVNTQVLSGLTADDRIVIQVEASPAANPFGSPAVLTAPGGQNPPADNRQPQPARPGNTGGRNP
jgi:RND family efflux transporter MFP subunit